MSDGTASQEAARIGTTKNLEEKSDSSLKLLQESSPVNILVSNFRPSKLQEY